jgi:hypothetical protein
VTWIPEEERTTPAPHPWRHPDGNFTKIDIVGGNNLQLHVCPDPLNHPHTALVH